jgi:hypothetical protein
LKSGSLKLLELSGPVQACNGIDIFFVTTLGYNHSSGTTLLAANKKLILQKGKDKFNLHVLYCGAVGYDSPLPAFE